MSITYNLFIIKRSPKKNNYITRQKKDLEILNIFYIDLLIMTFTIYMIILKKKNLNQFLLKIKKSLLNLSYYIMITLFSISITV